MRDDRNYKKSNKITEVGFSISEKSFDLAQKIIKSIGVDERQELSVDLLDELCDLAKIDIVQVEILAKNQKHRKKDGKVVMRQYGYYQPDKQIITITNQTAVRGAHLAGKTFLNTLLHEWVHHYDTFALKLISIHSKGFYLRLNHIEKQLRYGRDNI
ncbi:MAG: hypothetical protein UU46_C0003G0017 [Candidatus Uhrbacteria bacterium GW2011_GWD1_41_16]|uniref:Uncharacterized protein n=1 Tax=Candidatus Uhrbacteria bacterium GW2011_GWC1_41_20 TaxID=1618983 RepID=A0A0G0VEU2_9BACT|nr:MAG: hypothetical protein UT52_C0005G0024 [Candidatus Uhrbacteria bacterium GW2011_GWE1_39_46]KKR63628.1 MAG: hypothetical protein UU04_C0015G0017 [Candidatus Uhrbacteria bacterium GW2011_GWC2_40_450]KKR96400.1 MAG: hypothetical protein UU46_C0003G0017 [Candidatus Uhrbacteria bacterium GW2011_GWD1_41_16]KKR99414.1 MAG: hypothetical protein UU50_C0006G0017 [Candidatus Uhrbacteria bacterium GW2011_GWC1_41_20]KKS08354.1 MAG: hypothetical protein UU62_C0002G0024 [Candidatus Uhrbacteria bacterium